MYNLYIDYREDSRISYPQKTTDSFKKSSFVKAGPRATLVTSDSSQCFCMIIKVPLSVPGRLRTCWAALRGLSAATRRLQAAPTGQCRPGSQNLKIS